MFENKLFDLRPNINCLKKGFLNKNHFIDEAVCPINLPEIIDIERFTNDIYETWLNVK